MKLFRKMLCVLLSVITAVCLLPAFYGAADNIENYLTFEPKGNYGAANYHYEVSGCSIALPSVVNIPAVYDGYPVTKIHKEVFKGCGRLEEVTIPESVTQLYASAFENCLNLKKVTFKGTDVTLAASTFRGCSQLTSLTLPSAITAIPENSFNGCYALQSLNLPDTLVTIGIKAFCSCRGLKELAIPASVADIGEEAFSDCSGLEKISVDPANAAYKSVDNALFTADGTELIIYPAANERTAYTVPDGVNVLKTMAFARSTKLESVELADSVKEIEPYAFSEAAALKTVDLANVETIGSMAFAKCTELKEVTVPATVKDFGSAFVASGLEKVTLENGVKTISNGAFDSCKNLREIIIPESVAEIEAGAFRNCESLTQIVIPKSVEKIDKNAFIGISDSINLAVFLQSPAQKFAAENSIPFTVIDSDTKVTIGSGETEKQLAYYKTEKLTADASGLKVKWTTSDPKIVTVDSNGNIKAVGKGSAVITAAVEGYEEIKSSVTVTVTFTFWQKIVYFFRHLFGII